MIGLTAQGLALRQEAALCLCPLFFSENRATFWQVEARALRVWVTPSGPMLWAPGGKGKDRKGPRVGGDRWREAARPDLLHECSLAPDSSTGP